MDVQLTASTEPSRAGSRWIWVGESVDAISNLGPI